MTDIHKRLSTIETVIGNGLDIENVTDVHVSPLLAMCTRELSQWNHRVCFVLKCVKVLVSAVNGEEELSSKLQKTYSDVVLNKLPKSWNVSYAHYVHNSLFLSSSLLKINIIYTLPSFSLKNIDQTKIISKQVKCVIFYYIYNHNFKLLLFMYVSTVG